MLTGNNTKFKATPGFKGDKGDSAYLVAVKNGFVGTEQDWLATLGTTNRIGETKSVFLAVAGRTEFELPVGYTSDSVLEVYIEGEKLNFNEYTIDKVNKNIILKNPIAVEGTNVEIVLLSLATYELAIVETINENSTNKTTPGTKAVYDFVQANTNKVAVITGNTGTPVPVGTGPIIDVAYPVGFAKGNTVIIGRMCSSNNVYYDNEELTDTANGYPDIVRVALMDEGIRIWIRNTSTVDAKMGYYKITLMRVE